ncbi:ABC transporter substrate-binding protein [Rhodobacter sp. KR11]|uniref:MlaC/ttg2D family ABC transporter substrate-binding protein n=1 Tax=Rhodobacter sp. KR11 TaxID=2974588 RepID=UPI00222356B4|nr:ABC transporter substrate-binding protein [Rhodobacter sp. KR11]MCW1918369.1 ABC transporter substrate-binding protein [Rhodobacter sp. KR11]
MRSEKNQSIHLTRRAFGAGLAAGTGFLALALPVRALTVDQARGLIDKAVGDVNSVINSGTSESAMFGKFEAIFANYADVPTIARSALGPAAKQASAGQMSAFTKAYQGYISRKYGRRFREFIGGKIEVTDARPYKSYFEVISVATLQGESPFEVRWWVGDKSGKNLFFNIIIEGVNMLASERTEVGSLLDQNGGDVDKLIAALNAA